MINDKLWVMPTFMFLWQGPSQQYNFGSLVKIKLGNSISTTFFYAGAQFRAPLDAVILQARMDYKGFSVGFSYDINVSRLNTVSNSRGGFELSLSYTGLLDRNRERTPAGFHDPRF